MTSSEVTLIADTQDACGESPIWDDYEQALHWVDIVIQRLHTFDWKTQSTSTQASSVPVSAIALTDTASMIIAGANGVWVRKDSSETLPLARAFQDEALAINDCIADEKGRLLAGSTFFDGSDNYERGSLYVVDTDRTPRLLDTGFGLSNGLGFSPDGRMLYFTDSADRVIYGYDYSASDGTVARRRTLVKVPETEGLPDGLTVDAEGFIWSAQWFGGCLCRYDPDGKLERRVRIPAKQTSSLTFGGPDLTEIFVTTAAIPDAQSLAPRGYSQKGNVGGQLHHLNLGIRGRLEHRCRLTI